VPPFFNPNNFFMLKKPLPDTRKTLWRIGQILVLLVFTFIFTNKTIAQISVGTGTAPTSKPNGFEIDGNLVAGTAGDWLGSSATNSVLTATGAPRSNDSTFHLTDGFTGGDNVFAGGMKKNTNLNNWGFKAGNPSPSKCDINNFLLHISKAPNGHIWITLSGDRESVNGNSFISISLHQDTITLNNTTKKFQSPAPNSTGGRTEGDVSISAEFTGGGTNPNLYLEEWKSVGGVYQWADIDLTGIAGTVAYGRTNADILTGVPYDVFGQTPDQYQINSFIEVSFDITEIYKNSSTPCVGAIKSILVLTKSSQSVTADLADFVTPLGVSLNISVGKPSAPDKQYCVGQTTLDSTTATGVAGATFQWYTGYSNGTLSGLFDNNNILNTDEAVDQSTIHKDTFFIAQTLEGCQSDPDTVVIDITGGPTAPTLSVTNPTCSTSKGSVTVTAPTGSDYKYSFNDGSFGTSAGPFEFNAGAGYKVEVQQLSTGCVSDPTSCDAEVTPLASNSTLEPIDQRAVLGSKTRIKAVPNPFDQKVRFTMESYVSGIGSLEIYNMMGQRLSVVYQGYIEAGRPLVKEFTVPGLQSAALVYVFRVGNERVTGKLIQSK
jgi:hypothetical protein